MKNLELEKIEEVSINYGSPCPIAISDASDLWLNFYTGSLVNRQETATLCFSSTVFYSQGPPNEESLERHPYYSVGLRSGHFYQVNNSDLKVKLKDTWGGGNFSWGKYNHYIITFHDSYFTCIAEGFTCSILATDRFDFLNSLIKEIRGGY